MRGREVVITGMGVVSPIANELNLFWEGLKAGQSGIARVPLRKPLLQPRRPQTKPARHQAA